MNNKQIEQVLKQKKYFINKETVPGKDEIIDILCQKKTDDSYIILPKVETVNGLISAYDYLLNQINNQRVAEKPLLSLNQLLPTIKGDIFNQWKQREFIIEKLLNRLYSIQKPENEYDNDRYVIKQRYGRPNEFRYYVVDIEESVLAEIDGFLLNENLRQSAPLVKYPKQILNALKDNLENEYTEAYLEQIEAFRKI